MKAVVYDKFGPPEVLRVKEIEKPVPRDNEVLLKIYSASVNAYDWRHLRADPFLIRLMGAGLFGPKHPVLGADMSGIVESTGKKVKDFKPGDAIFGEGGYGGFAEYAVVDPNRFVVKPDSLSFNEAGATPMAALTALQGLRDYGKIQTGQKVLINGASGGVGSFAVQIAKSYGADVTGVCSTTKMDFVRSLGADTVIDYKKDDITLENRRYDLIFDTAAYHSFSGIKRILETDGRYVVAGGPLFRLFKLMFLSMAGNQNMNTLITKVNQIDLGIIRDLLEKGIIRSPIDKIFSLEDTKDAILHLEQGRVKGKVVIQVVGQDG